MLIYAQVYSTDESQYLIARALIDTGATQSSLAPRLAARLELPVERENIVQGIGGSGERWARYHLCLARLRAPDRPHQDHGSTRKVELEAHDALGDSAPFDMLLGMDALMQYRFVHLDGSVLTIDDGDLSQGSQHGADQRF